MMAATPARFRIRRYEPDDNDAVWRLHREGVMETTPQYLEVRDYERDLQTIEETYLEGGAFWLAESKDGTKIGITAVQRIDDTTARLRRMRVTPAWRKRGAGQALLDTAIEFCRERKFRKIILDTAEQQTDGQRLYERNGFVKTGERTLGNFRVFDYERRL